MIVFLEINKRFSVSSRRRKFLCETLVDTVKLEERTCVKENDGIGTVQSIKMLPVTPTSKVLPETNNKQLLDEVEHDIMNYQNRGLGYLPKPKAEADNADTWF